jgi:hypothetical protein
MNQIPFFVAEPFIDFFISKGGPSTISGGPVDIGFAL